MYIKSFWALLKRPRLIGRASFSSYSMSLCHILSFHEICMNFRQFFLQLLAFLKGNVSKNEGLTLRFGGARVISSHITNSNDFLRKKKQARYLVWKQMAKIIRQSCGSKMVPLWKRKLHAWKKCQELLTKPTNWPTLFLYVFGKI